MTHLRPGEVTRPELARLLRKNIKTIIKYIENALNDFPARPSPLPLEALRRDDLTRRVLIDTHHPVVARMIARVEMSCAEQAKDPSLADLRRP